MAREKKIRLPSATFVVARSHPGNVIGCDNELPWRLPSDLKRFKEVTSDHVVVMGRKTLDSIGRPLPNRTNVVLTRSPQQAIDGVLWANSIENAIFLADYHTILRGKSEFFVVGGDEIYRVLDKKDVFNKIYLTEVFCDVVGDAKFEKIFDRREWNLLEEEDVLRREGDEFGYRNTTYSRRNKTIRYGFLSRFLTLCQDAESFEAKNAQLKLEDWAKKHSDTTEQEQGELLFG